MPNGLESTKMGTSSGLSAKSILLWVTVLGLTRWWSARPSIPVLLPKVLIDGGSNLNIIFSETLKCMDFDFERLQPCEELFYDIVHGKGSYPISRVVLPVTFGTQDNYCTEHLTFEVANFKTSYHAILGRPMLARFMAIPHHTYLVLKMPAPNGVLSVYGDVETSYKYDTEAV
ncbi:uncharacterized protein LOC106804271 [Setaria italica]|uniref:uncharacterized protein LOC106804271 n=1 Tax=Setaria italica TaxID=4555 RepID=UPI0007199D0F|nr:uncharacterized protein LOC106804271 [Setaria italica]